MFTRCPLTQNLSQRERKPADPPVAIVTHERIDPTLHEKSDSVVDRMNDPLDVLARVETHVRGHGRDEGVTIVAELGDGDLLALEVSDRPDALGPEQLVAPRV